MKQFVLLAVVAIVAAKAVAGEKTCIPKEVSHVEPRPPPSIYKVTAAASLTDLSLSSDISVLEGIILSSPTFLQVETVIESYARSHYDTISLLESYIGSPSMITSPTEEDFIVTAFSTLAKAVSKLVSEEATHLSLFDIQSSLQSVMHHYPNILTDAETAFEFSHASLTSIESAISLVTISSPRIVTDVEVLMSLTSLWSSLASAVCDLTDAGYYYSTALHEITAAHDWTETYAWKTDKTLESIATCYPTLYSAVITMDKFLDSHQSDVSAVTSVLKALTRVPSIITDVGDFVTSVSTSLTVALTGLSSIEKVDSHITTEVSYIDVIEASHPSLTCAEGTLERDATQQSTISEIEIALTSPSQVTDATLVSSLEHKYPSILTALEEVTSVEVTHPSLSFVQSELSSEEVVDSTLLTDANEVISATSPSLIGDDYEMQKIASISPTITDVLHSLTTIFEVSPQLSCDESIIAQYASSKASVLYTLAVALQSPSSVSPSLIDHIAEMTAEYPKLASALRSVDSAEYEFSQLKSDQEDLEFVLTYEPSVISVYKQIGEYDSIVSGEVCGFTS